MKNWPHLPKVCHRAAQRVDLLYRLCHHCHLLHFFFHYTYCAALHKTAADTPGFADANRLEITVADAH
jgi:hypothetical protein